MLDSFFFCEWIIIIEVSIFDYVKDYCFGIKFVFFFMRFIVIKYEFWFKKIYIFFYVFEVNFEVMSFY